jgi:long-chain fatty acid transport protein
MHGPRISISYGAILATAAVIGLASPALAGGIWLNELMGTPDLGTASAGKAALAQDAATVFGNPAGMTKLDRSQLMVGAQLLYGDVEFHPSAGTTVQGSDGGNALGLSPSVSFSYAQSVTPDFKLGFWSGSYFGLAAEYNNDWVGRYYAQKVKLLTLGAGINAAYKVNDWLSIGGGPFALYGDLEQRVAVNNVLDGLPDGRLKVSDDELGVGGMAGIMLEPIQGTRFGVSYISPVDLDFKARTSTRNIGPTLQAAGFGANRKVKLGITVPQQVMVSAYHEINDRLAVMGNVVWQDWSEFGKPDVSISGTNVNNETADLNYDDTWGIALGAQYAFAEGWLWSVGGGYDSSPMSKSERSPSLPMDRQFRLGTGLQYSVNDDITVGFAYEYLNGGDNNIDVNRGPLAGRVEGDYKTYELHFFALNLNWQF